MGVDLSRFRIVPERSKVLIHAESSIHAIDGEASGLEGFVEVAFDDGNLDLSTVPVARVELPVDHLSSGNTAYDTEMRRRLDARRFPRITGELTKVEEARGEGVYRVEGDLTFHGTTRTVSTEIRVRFEGRRRLEAAWQQTIDIQDYGMKPPKILMFRVHPEVQIEVALVAETDEQGG